MRKILILLAVLVMASTSVYGQDPWTEWAFNGGDNGYSSSTSSTAIGGSNYYQQSAHRVEAISPLRDGGYVIVTEDGRVVTISSRGKITADNNGGRILEKIIPWVATLGIVKIIY